MSHDELRLKQQTDAAIVPVNLIWDTDLSYPARIAAQIILCHNQRGQSATRATLAQLMGAGLRAVDRWLVEIRDAGLLEAEQTGRCKRLDIKLSFRSTVDRNDNSSLYDLLSRVDRDVYSSQFDLQSLSLPNASNGKTVDKRIDSSSVGVGGTHDSEESDTNHTRPLKTELGRWLKHNKVNKAHVFDDPNLDYWLYRRDFERKIGEQWTIGMIVNSWLEAPLAESTRPIDELDSVGQAHDSNSGPWIGKTEEEAIARYELLKQRRRAS